VYKQWVLSWKMLLIKSALIVSMSLFLLYCVLKLGIVQWSSIYLVFVFAEIAAVMLALQNHTRDFLGIETGVKLSNLTVISGSLCMLGGISLILLASVQDFSATNTVFDSIFDISILCGLLIVIGGLLVLLGNNTLGAVMSIIFGFFPPPSNTMPGLPPAWGANHVFNIILVMLKSLPSPWVELIAGFVGSLPIVGGLIALASSWKLGHRMLVRLKASFRT
jgi:hypothetical protein